MMIFKWIIYSTFKRAIIFINLDYYFNSINWFDFKQKKIVHAIILKQNRFELIISF